MKAEISFFYNDEDDFDNKWNYNNQDFFLKNIWRTRWVLNDFEDSKYYDCVDKQTLEIKDLDRWKELLQSSEQDLQDYVYENEIEWLGDDFDHMQNYLSFIQDHIPKFEWSSTEEGYKHPEYLNIQTWIRKPEYDRVHVGISREDLDSFEKHLFNGEVIEWTFETQNGNTIEIIFEQE